MMNAGERVLLAPHLDVHRHRGPQAAAVVFGAELEAVRDPSERRRFPHPPRVIGDPLERDLPGLAHLGEQADHRALIFDLGLVDHALDGERVEHLADGLGVALLQDVDDGGLDRGDLGFGAARPLGRFYVACYIKRVGAAG